MKQKNGKPIFKRPTFLYEPSCSYIPVDEEIADKYTLPVNTDEETRLYVVDDYYFNEADMRNAYINIYGGYYYSIPDRWYSLFSANPYISRDDGCVNNFILVKGNHDCSGKYGQCKVATKKMEAANDAVTTYYEAIGAKPKSTYRHKNKAKGNRKKKKYKRSKRFIADHSY